MKQLNKNGTQCSINLIHNKQKITEKIILNIVDCVILKINVDGMFNSCK